MRLFVSVDLDGLKDPVMEVQRPFQDLPGIRVTDPKQAHITMKFLGENDHDLTAVIDAIEAAVKGANLDPFDAQFEGLGVFPSLDYISVIWLGVSTGGQRLTELHDALEIETTALGYDEEQHDFTPHVTLARMEHAAAKEDIQHHVREHDPTVGTMTVDELCLKESTLTPDGPKYDTIERFTI